MTTRLSYYKCLINVQRVEWHNFGKSSTISSLVGLFFFGRLVTRIRSGEHLLNINAVMIKCAKFVENYKKGKL
jgi:hypothetical protein